MSLVVYKLGGSLLDLPDLGQRLMRLWNSRPEEKRRLLIVGGGKLADVVREWDDRFGLGDEDAHELAVMSLGLSESLIDRMIPRLVNVTDFQDALGLDEGETGLVSVSDLLDEGEERGALVPRSWEFTTDAISAWLASIVKADELILLKSTDCGETPVIKELQSEGKLDGEFWNCRQRDYPIHWINLRDEKIVLTRLRG